MKQVSPHTTWLETTEEVGIVVATLPDRANDAHHLVRAMRIMNRQPFAEQRCNLVGKTKRYPPAITYANLCGAGNDRFQKFVRDRGNNRRDRTLNRNTCCCQFLQCLQSFLRRCCTRFKLSGKHRLETGDGYGNHGKPMFRKFGKQIDIPEDPV